MTSTANDRAHVADGGDEEEQEQHQQEKEVCSICLDELKHPVRLPCRHSFCSACWEGWRSKYSYDALLERKCPQCRATVPPSRDLLDQIRAERDLCDSAEKILRRPEPIATDECILSTGFLRAFGAKDVLQVVRRIEDDPDRQEKVLRESIVKLVQKSRAKLEEKERILKAAGEVLPSTNQDDDVDDLPLEICKAAGGNEVGRVLDWLGPPPVPARRLNAKCREKMNRTLLHEAQFENLTGLMRLLLQFGAKVDPKSAFGMTPLHQSCCYERLDDAARLLLTWGADKDSPTSEGTPPHVTARKDGHNPDLARLLRAPLGGRRCEIVGLQSRADLNGKTCVAVEYLRQQERYVVQVEE